MFIETIETPNPLTLKFNPGVDLIQSGTYSFSTPEDAKASPLAEALFKVEGVSGIFLGRDFITVSRTEAKEWSLMKADLLTIIADHLVAERPILAPVSENNTQQANGSVAEEGESDIITTIRELIDTRVRPAVAEDGGDIIFHGFEDGIVLLEMHGACSGCPSSTITLKEGIENMLKHYVPEVIAVEAVDQY